MADGLNTVPVLRMHLEELERTLIACEGLLAARDLQTQYAQMGTIHRPSKLTVNVTQQLDRFKGYLAAEEDEYGND